MAQVPQIHEIKLLPRHFQMDQSNQKEIWIHAWKIYSQPIRKTRQMKAVPKKENHRVLSGITNGTLVQSNHPVQGYNFASFNIVFKFPPFSWEPPNPRFNASPNGYNPRFPDSRFPVRFPQGQNQNFRGGPPHRGTPMRGGRSGFVPRTPPNFHRPPPQFNSEGSNRFNPRFSPKFHPR